MHTHRVTEIPINKALEHLGDVVVMHQAFRQPPSFENRGTTGVCLGHYSRIAGGVLVVSVVNGELKEVCSAKVRTLGEKVGQACTESVSLHVAVPLATRVILKQPLCIASSPGFMTPLCHMWILLLHVFLREGGGFRLLFEN